MAEKKSWEYKGDKPKTLDNIAEHWFIRDGRTPAWSAAQGGPAASAISRIPDSNKFLDRPTLHNPDGGILSAPGGEDHAYEAQKSLTKVDAMRRYEFLRRKANMDIEEETDNKNRAEDIRRQLGWPFSIGVISENVVTEEYEMGWEGVPVCNFCGASHIQVRPCGECMAVAYCDESCRDSHWHKHELVCKELKKKRAKVYTPEGKLLPADQIDPAAREAIALKARSASIFGEPVLFDFNPAEANETALLPGLKWKRGLIHTVTKKPANEDEAEVEAEDKASNTEALSTGEAGAGGSAAGEEAGADSGVGGEGGDGDGAARVQAREPGASGVYWDGPESRLGMLDLLVWKPLGLFGPGAVKAVGAKRSVALVAKGTPMPVPEKLRPKRVFGHAWSEKNLVSGQTSSFKKQEGSLAHANIQVTDWLTGATIYSYHMPSKTFTDPAGQGSNKINTQISRKEAKLKQLKAMLQEIADDEVETRENIQKWKKFKNDDKVKELERKLEDMAARKAEIEIRNRLEGRELTERREKKAEMIQALEAEEERKARIALIDAHKLPLPHQVGALMPQSVLGAMGDSKRAIDKTLNIPAEPKEAPEASDSDAGIFDFLGELLGGGKKDDSVPVEKYFGKEIIDPVTGKLVNKVVKRKNRDVILRARQHNKAVTDVMLSRSDGRTRAAANGRPTPGQKRIEQIHRKHQQKVADAMLQTALEQDIYEPRPEPGTEMTITDDDGREKNVTHDTATRLVVDLETWARREVRSLSVFGSTEYPMPKPQIATVQAADGGSYLSFSTLAKVQTDSTFKPSVTGPSSSHGKTTATAFGNNIVGWGLDPGDRWAHWTNKGPGQSAYNTCTPNTVFAGGAVSDEPRDDWANAGKVGAKPPARLGPKRSSLVLNRPYTPAPA